LQTPIRTENGFIDSLLVTQWLLSVPSIVARV
jgi:hypothetical protein